MMGRALSEILFVAYSVLKVGLVTSIFFINLNLKFLFVINVQFFYCFHVNSFLSSMQYLKCTSDVTLNVDSIFVNKTFNHLY
jgi:hypothetical protein